MTPERWQRVKEVVEAAWEQDASERGGFMDQACANAPELRSEVEALLASDESAGEFLAAPALDLFRGQVPGKSRESPAMPLEDLFNQPFGLAPAERPALLNWARRFVEEPMAGPGMAEDEPFQNSIKMVEKFGAKSDEGSPMIGRHIGPYVITGLIGEGGMGIVYEAQDKRLHRTVALKTLRESSLDAAAQQRLLREARVAAGINHPCICQMYDIGEHEGQLYLAMERLEGESLAERMSRGPVIVAEAIQIALGILAGLEVLHRKRLIHRDLKPANAFLTPHGTKLLDFGLSRAIHVSTTLREEGTFGPVTEAGMMVGTPNYMAPEQLVGSEVDGRADLFAVGAILFEMLTGRRAFGGTSTMEVFHAVLYEQPPALSGSAATSAVDLVARRALSKEPGQRYQTAHAMSDDLRAALLRCETAERVQARALTCAMVPPRARHSWLRPRRFWPALAGGAVLLAAGGLAWRAPWRNAATPIRSIAVLPLQNLSGDSSQNYFADGLTDELTTNLARIGSLRVISRTSTLQYAENRKPILQIGKELHVDAVIEGSVVRSGNRARITAQLIDARHDAHLWAQSYERDLGEILELQDSVARDIAFQVKASLSPEARTAFASHRMVNPEAYKAYLRGRNEIGRQTQDSIRNSVQYFQRAIDLDPLYATAYAGLADSFSLMANYSVLPPKEVFPRAEAAARKALDLDPGSPEAHASLAFAKHHFDWDWPGAEAEYRRAIQLSPSFPMGHLRYAEYLSNAGRHEEAIREIGRARELDPLSLTVAVNVGSVLFFARRYDDAIREFRAVLALNPNRIYAHMCLGMAYAQTRMYPEAIAEFQQIASGVDLAEAYALAGQAGEARRVLRDVERPSANGTLDWLFIAGVYTALGDRVQAFAWLEKAYENRDFFMTYLNVYPFLDALHSDPRFVRLQERVGVSKGPSFSSTFKRRHFLCEDQRQRVSVVGARLAALLHVGFGFQHQQVASVDVIVRGPPGSSPSFHRSRTAAEITRSAPADAGQPTLKKF